MVTSALDRQARDPIHGLICDAIRQRLWVLSAILILCYPGYRWS
jgi:hypothetical protein